MLNHGDDDMELDNISREAAGKYIVPGKADWSKIEAELAKALPLEKKKRFGFFWWLLPFILLAGGAGYWLIQDENKNGGILSKNKTTAISIPALTATPSQATEKQSTTASENTKGNRSSQPATGVKLEAKQSGQNAITKQTPAEKDKPSFSRTLTSQQTTEKKNSTQADAANENALSIPVVANDQQPATKAVRSESEEEKNKNDSSTGTSEPEKKTSAITNEETEKKTLISEPGPASAPVISTRYPVLTEGLSFALVAGLDKSTVKYSYGDEAGYNIGLIGGYHFNKRFSIHTGAILTQKNYKMAGRDFTAPKGSMISYYNLETVQGYCRMWEFPLIGRYSFSQHAKNNYFVSVGLSSYFMNNEHYSYAYYWQGQPTTRNASYTVGGNHVFSVMHLSVGYEKRLSKNLNLQIEPYAKLPLSGMGYGSIRLSSFGLNLGLQFRQPSGN